MGSSAWENGGKEVYNKSELLTEK